MKKKVYHIPIIQRITPICTHRCQSPKYSRTVLLSTLYQSNVYTQTFQQKKRKEKKRKQSLLLFCAADGVTEQVR